MKIKLCILSILSLTTITNGGISMTFEYNTATSDTTVMFSGSWDIYTGGLNTLAPQASQVDNGFFFINGGTNYNFTLDDKFTSPFSWTAANATSSSGDNFGFDNQFAIYAPVDYSQGDQISGTATFAGTDLASFGLTDGETGSYTSNLGNTVSYSVTSVPEPSSIILISLFSLAITVRRRRN